MYRIGAVFGSNFGIWDISKLQGGKPFFSVPTFPEGAHKFRYGTPRPPSKHALLKNRKPFSSWCPTNTDYFAISSSSPSPTPSKKGASIHLYNAKYLHAQPNAITISNVPHRVRDFDWLAVEGVPRLVVAFGRDVLVFPIGVEG